jgi:fumarate reductase flavoprotein subunit
MGVLLGIDGHRFTDEGLGGVAMANAIAQLDDPLSAMIIFDEKNWTGEGGRAPPVPANPGLFDGGASIYSAPTLQELAAKAGISADGLVEAVRQHNESFESNSFEWLRPPRTVGGFQPGSSAAIFKHGSRPQSITTPPYHAIPVCAGITLTMGGIQINSGAQALKQTGEPIRGLYVAGTPVRGLEGGPRAGYVGGLCKAFVLGLVAAEHSAAEIAKAEVSQ